MTLSSPINESGSLTPPRSRKPHLADYSSRAPPRHRRRLDTPRLNTPTPIRPLMPAHSQRRGTPIEHLDNAPDLQTNVLGSSLPSAAGHSAVDLLHYLGQSLRFEGHTEEHRDLSDLRCVTRAKVSLLAG
jgi:hypothetical protein